MIHYSLLKDDRINLDRLNHDDLVTIQEWYKDEEFTRNMDAILSIPKQAQDIQKIIEEKSDKDYVFAIRDNKTNVILGIIGIDGILWNHRTAWLSVGIGRDNRGKGYGKDALKLIMKLAFLEFNLYRLQLTVFEYNEKAMALYEELGFVKEGSYRSFLERDNKRFDMLLYGILRDEYFQKKIEKRD